MPELPTPPPKPTTTAPSSVANALLHSVWHGIWQAFSSSPWLAVLLAAFIALAVLRVVRKVIYPSGNRDPVRLFSGANKAMILARAGGRCERHSWVTGRCQELDNLQADHVIPWSRSGTTSISNGQALCKHHNRAKAANVPFKWQRRALDKRRESYL
jgi:hypothetical protein